MEHSNKAQSMWKIKFFLWCKRYFAIWSNSQEHSSIWATGTMYMNFDKKHSPNGPENQKRLQNSAHNTRKSLVFCYPALYLNKFHQVSIKLFLKILSYAEIKIVTNYVHLVIWSRGFPTLVLYGVLYGLTALKQQTLRSH